VASAEQGLFHVRADGSLISWRNETSQWWQRSNVAANARNSTVCWVFAVEDHEVSATMRCAPADDLDSSWDLPQPKGLRVNDPDALAIDWVTGNWYMTESRVNYICSHNFDQCVKVGETGGDVRYYAAYDIPNRLLFMLATDSKEKKQPYRLETMRLDGSDRRIISREVGFPSALGVDSAGKHVYWVEGNGYAHLLRVDYSGKNKTRVSNFDDQSWEYRRDISVAGDNVFVMWGDQKRISHVNKATETVEDVLDSAVQGATPPEQKKVEKLLDIEVFSNETQPEVENLCSLDNGGCGDLCVPTVVNGTASRTCFCEEGYELLDTACQKIYPATVVIVRQNALQALDLDSGTTSTILSGLTDATRLDFWADEGEYLLFWLDDGGLFRGRWTPGGQVTDVQALTPAGQTARATDLVVEWRQRNVFWIEKDGDQMRLKVANLNGTAIATMYSDDHWWEQRALITLTEGFFITFSQVKWSWKELELKAINMDGENEYSPGFVRNVKPASQPTEWASDLSSVSNPRYHRYFWAVNGDNSIDYVYTTFGLALVQERLLTDPTLANTGGLDVFGGRIFWADNNAEPAQLMSANIERDGDVRAVEGTGGSPVRAVRVVHARKQPPSRRPVCDGNGCSDMCQAVLVNYRPVAKCTCGDGKSLGEDKKTCE